MKFTKGLFLGTALGISAAIMMNNRAKSSKNQNKSTGVTAETETQINDSLINDII